LHQPLSTEYLFATFQSDPIEPIIMEIVALFLYVTCIKKTENMTIGVWQEKKRYRGQKELNIQWKHIHTTTQRD
jgi:predicted Ser/Thr protein kinase